MAYVMPTLDDFQETFPEFEDFTDEQVEFALAAAARQVDETWLEGDYRVAILYLTAHLISVAAAGVAAVGQDDIKSLTIGPLSLSFGSKVSLSEMSSTTYGQNFASLQRRNVFPIVAIGPY